MDEQFHYSICVVLTVVAAAISHANRNEWFFDFREQEEVGSVMTGASQNYPQYEISNLQKLLNVRLAHLMASRDAHLAYQAGIGTSIG